METDCSFRNVVFLIKTGMMDNTQEVGKVRSKFFREIRETYHKPEDLQISHLEKNVLEKVQSDYK
jgi:hypothetical protein